MTIPNHDITKLKADLALAQSIRDMIPPGTHDAPSPAWLREDAKVAKIHQDLQAARKATKAKASQGHAPSTKMFIRNVGCKDEHLVPIADVPFDKR